MAVEEEGLEPEFDMEVDMEAEEAPKKTKKKPKEGKTTPKQTKKPQEVEKVVPVAEKPAKKTKKAKKKVNAQETDSVEPASDDSKQTAAPTLKKKKKEVKETLKEKKKRKAQAAKALEGEQSKEVSAESQPVDSAEKVESSKKSKKNMKRKAEEGNIEGGSPAKKPKTKKEKESKNPRFKYAAILEKVKEVNVPFKVREILSAEVAAGALEAAEVTTVFQQWRRTRKFMASEDRVAKVVEMEGTVDDVKRVINELVNKRLLFPHQVGEILHKWRNRERRRLNRQEQKLSNKFCFNCRKSGHQMSDCPEKESEDSAAVASGICFKCGSGEHNIYACPRKHVKGFPFATCFVCNEQGHLSRDCGQNVNGIYPDGGCCNVCGSQKHLKRDCPELALKKKGVEEKKVVARTMTAMSRADEDYDLEAPVAEVKEQKKKVKVVKF